MGGLLKARTSPPAEQQPPALEHYRNRVKLDRHALDLAAEEQPGLFLEVAEQRVLARSRYDEARDDLLRTDARLGREARAEMEKTGVKPTEGKVADVVLGAPDHLGTAEKASQAKRGADDWDALVSAFEHRKSMIRELATLYAAGYYTAGVARGAAGQVRDTAAAAGREAMTAARERRER